MPLVNAKCTNCGTNLTVDEAKDADICKRCGAAFIVEKAIKNYSAADGPKSDALNICAATNDFDIRGGVLVKYNGVSIEPKIPDTVVKIGKKAFAGTMITSVSIPDTVTEIDSYAFLNCKNLLDVKMSSYTEIIGYGAFCCCESLKEIYFPNRVREIHQQAFRCCKALKKISIPESVDIIEKNAFMGCISLFEAYLPEKLIAKYQNNYIQDYYVSIYDYIFRNTSLDVENCSIAKTLHKLRREEWRSQSLCQYCGGNLSGFFTKKCRSCGKPKDY